MSIVEQPVESTTEFEDNLTHIACGRSKINGELGLCGADLEGAEPDYTDDKLCVVCKDLYENSYNWCPVYKTICSCI